PTCTRPSAPAASRAVSSGITGRETIRAGAGRERSRPASVAGMVLWDPSSTRLGRGHPACGRPAPHLGSEIHDVETGDAMTPEARIQAEAGQLDAAWRDDPRWQGVERTYGAADVVRLRGSVVPENTVARLGAERLWELLQREQPTRALGAITGGQAVQMIKAGLEAVYLSGWQVGAAGNLSGGTYPGQCP